MGEFECRIRVSHRRFLLTNIPHSYQTDTNNHNGSICHENLVLCMTFFVFPFWSGDRMCLHSMHINRLLTHSFSFLFFFHPLSLTHTHTHTHKNRERETERERETKEWKRKIARKLTRRRGRRMNKVCKSNTHTHDRDMERKENAAHITSETRHTHTHSE